MIRFLLLTLMLTFAHSASAQGILESYIEDNANPKEVLTTSDKEQKPLKTIIRKVEKEIIPMPSCNDEKLLVQTRKFVEEYFAKRNSYNVRYRRHKHFVLNNLNDFSEENIANYKTSATSPVSDIIIELKMNQKIIEENMRLCKKTLPNDAENSIYLLTYPFENGYKVQVLNLEPNKKRLENNIFTYGN